MTGEVSLQAVTVGLQQNTDYEDSYKQKASEWVGRGVEVVSDVAFRVLAAIRNVVDHVFRAGTAVSTDTNALAAVFRKLDGFIFKAVEVAKNVPGYFNGYGDVAHKGVGVIDVLQVAGDVDYFATQKYKDDSNLGFASRVALAVTNAGGGLLWLDELSFISLKQTASSIGQTRVFGVVAKLKEVRIFSYVPKVVAAVPGAAHFPRVQAAAKAIGELRVFSPLFKITMGTFVLRALTLTYALMAAEAFQRWMQPGNDAQTRQAGLDLSWFTSELVIDAAVTFGMTNVIGLGALATACAALAASTVIHRAYNAQALQEPIPAVALPSVDTNK